MANPLSSLLAAHGLETEDPRKSLSDEDPDRKGSGTKPGPTSPGDGGGPVPASPPAPRSVSLTDLWM